MFMFWQWIIRKLYKEKCADQNDEKLDVEKGDIF